MAQEIRMDANGVPIQLNDGLTLTTPGMDGFARVHTPMAAVVRGAELGSEVLEQALAQTGWTELSTLELEIHAVADTVPPHADVRGPGDEPALELTAPDPGEDWGMAVLAQDEAGALTWHFPVDEANQPAPVTRGGSTRTFRIPRTAVEPLPGAEGAATRGLLGLAGRKVMKLLVYPVTDRLLGPVSERFALRWEEANRKPQVRHFTSQSYMVEDAAPVAPEDWPRLTAGRALLFIHGTFSRSTAGFGALDRESMEALEQRYGGRVIAFDHPTLSVDPLTNVRWFMEALPPGTDLTMDIVAHSRGGLVARTLAELGERLGVEGRRVRVGRVIFVAVPNGGTPLANGEHMTHMLDRFTTVVNLFPFPGVQLLVEGLLVGVKLLGHGALRGLPGLAAMRPADAATGESFQQEINAAGLPGGRQYYALTSDFDPVGAGLAHLVRSREEAVTAGANSLMDRVFREPNDLVVPTLGVYAANGNPNFPLPPERVFHFGTNPTVTHVNFFAQPETRQRLLEWLEGDSPVER